MKLAKYIFSSLLAASTTHAAAVADIYDIEVETITGKKQSLREFAGKVIVIVNTASRCGFTKQYAGLVALQKEYADKGVTVVGFPSGDFGGQELAENAAIAEFCEVNFGVDFPLMAKTSVKGDNQHPLFAYLTSAANPDFTGDIRWNFEKFIIDRNGVLQRRFRSRTTPDSKTFREALDQILSP
jgi:glutathione peroxidase